MALLIGTTIGPIVTPWASLATLLWLGFCRHHGLTIGLRKFMLIGLGLAATAIITSIKPLNLASEVLG